jgi:dTDP-4-amino-4,6-dideoxygalactose transaminase
MIRVTQPSLPPLHEFVKSLEEIWESRNLTNNGKFHQEFERELADFLGVKYISLFANGTLALITALQVLRITGEVITTPYSFVATTHALHWNGIKPVFCDIHPSNMNLDPAKIEYAISPKTTAILPVHIYGHPCNVEEIANISNTYGLKVIYDAAHSFGVKINNNSICNFGDLSILSFHATKVFNTFEGGAIICHDINTKKRIDYLKNFGFAGETTVVAPGINAKMNEFQAALGLLQLKYYDENLKKRKNISEIYYKELINIAGIKLIKNSNPDCDYNYAYFPVFIDKNIYGKTRDHLYEEFKKNDIFTRRYFYPLISHFPTYKGLESSVPGNLPFAEKASDEVLCLPLYPDLEIENVYRIIEIIKQLKIN